MGAAYLIWWQSNCRLGQFGGTEYLGLPSLQRICIRAKFLWFWARFLVNILYHFVGWATWATDFSPLWYRFLQCSRFWYRDSRASAFALGFFLGICSWSCKQRWQWFGAIGKPARRQAWWPPRVGTEWLAVSIFHICSSLQLTSSLSLKMRIHMSHVVNYRVLSHDLGLHSKRVLKVLAEKR